MSTSYVRAVSTLPALFAAIALVGCGDPPSGMDDSASASSVTIASVTVSASASASASGGSDTASSDSDSNGSDSDSGAGTGESASAGSDSNASDSGASDSNGSDGGLKFDLGDTPDIGGGCNGGMGGIADESFIWIPGTSDGTVAKIDTRTLVEVGRYAIGPAGGSESASRTAVSGDGRFVVVNSRGTGRSTAVAANVADCVDTNNNGMIDTSLNSGDIRPWGSDECVVWTNVHPTWGGSAQQGPRGITWTIGDWNEATCSFINQKVWLGFLSGGGEGHLVRFDGATGTQEELLAVPGWNGSGYAPYGGALDPDDRPWFTGLRGELVRVNSDQNPATVTRFNQPGNIQTYGMTVDPNGNPWMAGCSGPVSTYDVGSNQWFSVPGTAACHRGMAIDHDFHVWVASNGPCELVEIDGATRTLIQKHQLAQCSTPIGVSVDVDGYVWLVDQLGWAWKIDPANVGAMQQIPVSGNHYVYSDMTGGQLKSVTQPPG
jgi:hypothetical protein